MLSNLWRIGNGHVDNHDPVHPSNPSPDSEDPTASLKRGLEKTRLTAELKAQIVAELPPWEEMERMFRELQQEGGLSFDEFCASLSNGLMRPDASST